MNVKLRVLTNIHLNSLKNIIILSTKIMPIKFLFVLILLVIQVVSYSQEKTFTAQKGDGIYSVLRDNGLSPSCINKFLALNKKTLKGSRELKAGVNYILPAVNESKTDKLTTSAIPLSNSTSTKRFSIFGSKYQDISIESNILNGAVYFLVSGHGGPDPGAVGKYNGKLICEDEYAYDITLRLARNLLSLGATVYMITRDNNDGIRDGWYLSPDKDEKCYPNRTIPINQNRRLQQRKDAVNTLYKKYKGNYQRLMIIHVDSRSKGENIDVFFYHDKRSKTGDKFAKNLRDTFNKKYNTHQPGRGYKGSVSSRNLYMLKYSWPVATFIELGNINHQRDIKRFIIEDNRQALANWLSEGMILDFKNNR